MMKTARIPLDKLQQQKQTLEWQQADYRTLNTALVDFQTNGFDTRFERTFLARNAASSNESAATATAGANATDGTYNITVTQLATGVSKASTDELVNGKATDGSSLTLFEQFPELANRPVSSTDPTKLTSTDTISVTINGTDLEFNLDTDNLGTVVGKINEANLGVTASYDSSQNRFFLNSNSTGSDAQIAITDSANFFSKGSYSSILNLDINDKQSYTGENASIDFGDAKGLLSASNAITVNGITLNLKKADVNSTITITVTRNTDGVVDSITKFVDAYNKTLNTVTTKVQETYNKDFPPLTDAQKKTMSESQINEWNAKAKSGLLRTDEKLKSIINSFRYTTSGPINGIDGAYNSLSSIGIKTQANDRSGKLFIDKDALRGALTKDPDSVKELFTNTSTDVNEQGIAAKIYKTTVDGISYLVGKASSDSSASTVDSSYIGKQITKLGTQITDWEKKLKTTENKYYAKFTAMETTIYKLGAQSSWLNTMLGSSK
jgi:flagellar hook-associated protein 2